MSDNKISPVAAPQTLEQAKPHQTDVKPGLHQQTWKPAIDMLLKTDDPEPNYSYVLGYN